jgi:hypothetical protein
MPFHFAVLYSTAHAHEFSERNIDIGIVLSSSTAMCSEEPYVAGTDVAYVRLRWMPANKL